MKIFSYVLVILGTIIGGFTFFDTMISADTIPQQQAGVIIAIAWAVLPYCFARAVEKIGAVSFTDALDKYFVQRGQPIAPVQPLQKQANGINLGSTPRPN